MVKKRIGKLLLALIIVWLVITIYFYFQHRVTVQVMKVPGWSLDNEENQGVLVKEIRVSDWEPNNMRYIGNLFDRWKPVLELGNKLPSNIRMKYFHIVSSLIYFYYDPYQKLEDGVKRVQIIGWFLNRQLDNSKNVEHPKVRLYSNTELIVGSRGFGMMHSGDSNFYLFNAHYDDVYIPIEDSLKITWQWDDGTLVTKKITNNTFESKTYNFFNPPPNYYSNLNPDRKASEFINSYKNGQNKSAQNMISDQVEDFPWQHIEWIKHEKNYDLSGSANYYGEYKGLRNAFTVELTTIDSENSEDYTKQKIFLVHEDDEWKVIDISPPN